MQNEDKLYPSQTDVAYEDKGKVHKVKDGKVTLLYDIGLKKGDKIYNIALVIAEEYIYKLIEDIGARKDES